MKNVYMFGGLAIVLIALFSFNLALAEEGEASVSISPVISVNDSEDEYVPSGFKFGWEKFKLNFIRNETLKAEKELELARWKIAEAKMATKNGNIEKAEKAMEQHDALLVKVQERIARLENGSLTPGLDQAIFVHEQKLENLNLLLQSSNLTDEQRAKIEIRISKIENNTLHLEEVRLKIEEKRRMKLDSLENKTQRIEQEFEERQDKMKFREKIKYANGSEEETEIEIEYESEDNSDDDSSEDSNEDSEEDSDDDSSGKGNSTN